MKLVRIGLPFLFLATVALDLWFIARTTAAQEKTESVAIFKFETMRNPSSESPTLRKWNWEIKLPPTLGKRRFRIAQETRGTKGRASEYSMILFNETELQKNSEDIIHFKLHSGDENPTRNMNKAGNVGLGISFSRVGGGFGASNWIVLPGPIVRSEAHKQAIWQNGELVLLSIDSKDALGNSFQTVLKLEESK
jgi:hypothetical protein